MPCTEDDLHQMVRPGGEHIYPPSHLTSPQSHISFVLNSIIILDPIELVLKSGQLCELARVTTNG